MSNSNIDEAVQKTVDYLYTIKGECSPELYTAINRLRQLINEEFVGKNKLVSSQLIFDILEQAIQQELLKARIDLIKQIFNSFGNKKVGEVSSVEIFDLLDKIDVKLQKELKENSDG